MEQINTLVDRQIASGDCRLPAELRLLYGGDLWFPAPPQNRPYVIGNFVSTLDGVVSYEIPGKSGGGEISGFDEADRFIMGLLRASADAVIVGAGTLQATSQRHVWTAEHVYPGARDLYQRYRGDVLKKLAPPLNVVVSGSGRVDLNRAVFRTPGVKALIITTEAGGDLLPKNGAVEVRVIQGAITPALILESLRGEFGVNLLLHEGGPRLFGQFVASGSVDELFLTMAPQFAGRSSNRRPGVVAGVEFLPETAPWLELVTLKQGGDHLYLRYRMRENSSGQSALL